MLASRARPATCVRPSAARATPRTAVVNSRGFATAAPAAARRTNVPRTIIPPRAHYNTQARPIERSPHYEVLEASFGIAGAAVLLGAAAYILSDNDDKAEAAEASFTGNPGTDTERTFIAIKPDGVQRGLIGEIIARFEKKGYKLVAVKVVQPSESFAKQHYADLAQKPFFPGLVKYFSSGPVFAMVWEGKNSIVNGRKIIGATNPANAEPGSIRGDLCIETGRNIVRSLSDP